MIDIFGVQGVDPGDGWTIDGVTNATKDSVITRNSSVQNPTTTWNPSEWTRLGAYVDGVSGSTTLGTHTYNPE